MSLIYFRVLAGAIISLIIATWFYGDVGAFHKQMLLFSGVLFLFLLVVQTVLTYSKVALRSQYLIGYGSDALLAGLLIFVTGGVTSPFAFLLGLIIIASGLHAMRLLPQLIAVFACIFYLAAANGDLWLRNQQLLDVQQALHALLQVSALLLVGGVMAYISRRHAALSATSDHAVRRHRQLKDLYDRVMQSMHEGMVVLDENLQLSDMNGAAGRLLGSLKLDALLSAPELKAYFEQPSHSSFQCDYVFDDKVLLVRVTRLEAGEDATWLLTLVDISEVRKLEGELLQQEKMAALGQMAAMLAHEIRNPIQTMSQGLEFIGMDEKRDLNIKEIMYDEMQRLNRLVSTMLEYSKPLRPLPVSVAVADLIRAAVQQVEMGGAEHIVWQCDAEMLQLDPDHFRLLLDNLLSNALANRDENGEVRIAMHASGMRWNLKVCNPGLVADALKERLFEPFVSGRSRGVGLGLATVQQVCRANGWLIDVSSDDGLTCFNVTCLSSEFTMHEAELSNSEDKQEINMEEEHG